jgi:FkbM family methyltransferase
MNELAQLKNLLSESIASAIEREQVSFDRLTSPLNNSLVLFGAGVLGRKTLTGLRQIGIEPLAFADNNKALWGEQIEDILVFSPQDAVRKFGNRAAFVVTIWRAGGNHRFGQTRQQLLDLGCLKVVSFAHLFWKFAHIFLPYYAIGLPHLLLPQSKQVTDAFALWADDASRNEYLAQIRWRLQLDFDGLASPLKHVQYFPEDLFDLSEEEIFVDCGAYDGDSLRDFFQIQPLFKGKFIAIEPDPHNLKSLKNCIVTLPDNLQDCVTILPVALGEHRTTVSFAATGLPSAGINSAGTYELESVPLDEVLGDLCPTFIKMDIEGAEYDALNGARHSIKKNLPVLAISVYHQPDDLWRIPLLIQSFSGQYRFFLRPHNEEGWDLICYAIPVNRLKIKLSGT